MKRKVCALSAVTVDMNTIEAMLLPQIHSL
jgi:hypothetical protein